MTPKTFPSRRAALTGAGALLASGGQAFARRDDLAAIVFSRLQPGTIVISLSQRRLFLTQAWGPVLSWRVAIGRGGRAWSGWARVEGKHFNPAWSPPAEVKRDNPRLPDIIPGGAPDNPMGARALTLDRREFVIHGTSRSMRGSIGTAASWGCVRKLNEDIIDLFNLVSVGTPVLATP